MRPFLIATFALCTAFSLAGCDAADRAALAGAKAPASIGTPAPAAPQPTPVDAALLFPPAKAADAPHLIRISTAPRHIVHAYHRRIAHGGRGRIDARVRTGGYVEQTVIRDAYGDPAYDRQIRRQIQGRVEASDRWDERRSSFSEGYDLAELRDARPPAAGRDRDGFLTWPGKISDRP